MNILGQNSVYAAVAGYLVYQLAARPAIRTIQRIIRGYRAKVSRVGPDMNILGYIHR